MGLQQRIFVIYCLKGKVCAMPDEKRIYLMTQLALFEKNHRNQLDGVNLYFRGDYIGRYMIKTSLRVTLAFLLILAGWGLYHAEMLIVDITKIDVAALGARILFLYALTMCVFLVLTYAIHAIRYARAQQDLYHYRELLKRLERAYRREDGIRAKAHGRDEA